MKRILILMIASITLYACKKRVQENTDWFQIEITAQKDIDCGAPNITFLTRQQEAFQIIGDSKGQYVALGLPKVNYPVGTKMYVTIHRPSANEIVFCTAFGPSWAQVFIDKIK
jgi:hypothetical protein